MQTYKVVISDLAKADLRNIVSYISETESITIAKYVERGILSEMKKLAHFPAAYPKDEYASTNEKTIRFLVKWSYKILFFIDINTVQVAGIFHTAQNPDKLLLYHL
ncbi:MAG: type II toxin-antitoxin system RelE/ParE family toxin [Candidatus Azobacteroides sp.]|nr:type II toxin-antitoxin system RelE/ParE family toxin [Candidatus Azobacteroides sp.]